MGSASGIFFGCKAGFLLEFWAQLHKKWCIWTGSDLN